MSGQRYPLEPGPDDMRAMAEAAVSFVVEFVEKLPDSPASDPEGAEDLARSFREPPPEEGAPFADLLDVVDRGAARAFNTTGPGYLAYIPGGGLFASALADLVADVTNRFTGIWTPAPALVQLEWNVIRWLCDQFGYPDDAAGILTSGGSMANFSAVVAARRSMLPEEFLDGTLYVSEEVHLSVTKAAVLAGLPQRNVRSVPCTEDLRMDVDAFRAMLKEDRDAGLKPFCVVASAGTVNTGAVDSIADLAAIAADEGLWFHVDGAYGGFFQLTERGRRKLRGIESADSITLDPHKGMFLPYGTGCLLVRDGERLRSAHTVAEAGYLQDLASGGPALSFSEYSPELSRDFRGLRVWLPIKLHGLRAFREALDEKLDLARFVYEELEGTPGFEVPWEPELSIVPFRYVPETEGSGAPADRSERSERDPWGEGDADEFNRNLLDRINSSRRVFLSSTVIRGRVWLRTAILSVRTHRDRVEEAVDIIRRAAGGPGG